MAEFDSAEKINVQQLSEILLPVYQSAKNCGFGSWVYDKQG